MKLDEFLGQVRDTDPLESRREFQGEDFSSGVERGAAGLRAAGYGAAAGLTGNQELADRADYAQAQAQDVPRRFNSFRDVNPLNPLDLVDYGQQVAGEQTPNLLAMAADGGVPGAIAKSAMAARVGAGAASAGMQFGEMSNELREIGKRPDLLTGGLSIVGGALDVFGLESLGKNMLDSTIGEAVKAGAKADTARRVLSGAWQGFKAGLKSEMPAELLQEDLSIINRVAHDPSYLGNSKEITNRLEETAASTAAFAAPGPTARGAFNATRPAPQRNNPSQTHNMTLDEMGQLPPSSTPQGATHGEETRQESTNANANETGQKQEVLKRAGVSTPGPYDEIIDRAAKAHGVTPDELHAIMRTESAGNPNAVSSKGATGLMQLMPDTAAENGVTDINDPEQNIFGGARYYRKMLDRYNGDRRLALAAYNAGPGTVDKFLAGKQDLPEETQKYVAKVTSNAPAGAETSSGTMGSSLGRHWNGQEFEATAPSTALNEDHDVTPTDNGFDLTFKGQKHESTGHDLFKPDLEVHGDNKEQMDGVAKESTAVRAFQQVYPQSTVNKVADDARKVSVTLPRHDALSDTQTREAAAVLTAFNDGKAAGQGEKILLEHPEVKSQNSGKPIEIPTTRDGLAKIGYALDPNLNKGSESAYQAAMSGLAHLVYDHGFIPRGVNVNDEKQFTAWIEKSFGKPEVKEESTKASDRPMGLVRPQLPITHLMSEKGSSAGRDTAKRLNIPHLVETKSGVNQPTSRVIFESKTTETQNSDAIPTLRISKSDLEANPKSVAFRVYDFLKDHGGERPSIAGDQPIHSAVLRAALMPNKAPEGDEMLSNHGFDQGAFVPENDEPSRADELGTPTQNEGSTYRSANKKERSASVRGVLKGLHEKLSKNRTANEKAHAVDGGSTIRATGVGQAVVNFFRTALSDIGLRVPVRVIGQTAVREHLDALQQSIEETRARIERMGAVLEDLNAMPKREIAQWEENNPGVTHAMQTARAKASIQRLNRLYGDLSTEQNNLINAMEDNTIAARIIYNDHYQEQARRIPIVVINEKIEKSDRLSSVLAHELGHLVQRAWFDQLPSKLQTEILRELSQDGRYSDVAEAFADKFMSWYLNNRETVVRTPNGTGDIRDTLASAFGKLAQILRKTWENIRAVDKAFRHQYPKFDEFLRSTVTIGGKMKPVNPRINAMWQEALAQPYGGLPAMTYDTAQFHDMTAGQFTDTVQQAIDEGKQRAVQFAKNKAGENVIANRYIRKAGETMNALKHIGQILFTADGEWFRRADHGLFGGYADMVANVKGLPIKDLQVIGNWSVPGVQTALHTNELISTIQNLINSERGTRFKHLIPVLQKLGEMTPEQREATLAELRDERKENVSPLTRQIRLYLNNTLGYMRLHGVRIRNKKNYFPKIWDKDKLMDNKEEAIATFEKIFAAREQLPTRKNGKGEPVPFQSAREVAVYEYNRIVDGTVDNVFDMADREENNEEPELRGPSFRFSRSRMFDDSEYLDHGLDQWLVDDIAWTLTTYTNHAVKRAVQQTATGIPSAQLRNQRSREAWRFRFINAGLDPDTIYSPIASLELLLAEGAQDGRLDYDTYLEARKRIRSTLGMTNVGFNPRARRWTDRIIAYETLLTMGWSGFMQLSDFGISIWRADSMERVGSALSKMMDGTSIEQQRELLSNIGLALDEMTRHAATSDLSNQDPISQGSQWVTEKFFRLNGMHWLSDMNLILSSILGQSYIQDKAREALAGDSKGFLALQELHPTLTPQEALSGDWEGNPNLRLALHEYVSQSHLHNQQGYTSRIFGDYRFKIFTMLKGFMFKYHNIVLKQMWQRMKQRPDLLSASIPLLSLAACTMPLALAGMEAKDALRRGLFPKVKRAPKEKTPTQLFHDVLMATGMPGVYVGLFDSTLEAPQHGQPGIVALMGPIAGQVYNWSSRTADEWIPSSIPLIANVPWLRSQAREGLRETFGFGVRNEDE